MFAVIIRLADFVHMFTVHPKAQSGRTCARPLQKRLVLVERWRSARRAPASRRDCSTDSCCRALELQRRPHATRCQSSSPQACRASQSRKSELKELSTLPTERPVDTRSPSFPLSLLFVFVLASGCSVLVKCSSDNSSSVSALCASVEAALGSEPDTSSASSSCASLSCCCLGRSRSRLGSSCVSEEI